MKKKSIRNYVIEELHRRSCPYSLPELSRVINGQRSAQFSVARELADILRTRTDIWQDKDKGMERMAALERLAVRKKMGFFVGRGRPLKGE